jgi:excisionase family DNA binding protein
MINAMKLTPDGQLLAALQQTVSTAFKQWLDDNKGELLGVARDAVLESEASKQQQRRQEVTRSEFLTVAEVAQRWQLHPESVRRMIRQGRVPRVVVGRHNRVALATVEAFEKSGAVPNR